MSIRALRRKTTQLVSAENEFLKIHNGMHNSLHKVLPTITTATELSNHEPEALNLIANFHLLGDKVHRVMTSLTSIKRLQRNLSVSIEQNKLVIHSNRLNMDVANNIISRAQYNYSFLDKKINNLKLCEDLLREIAYKKAQFGLEIYSELAYLRDKIENNCASTGDISRWHEFLSNPKVKTEVTKNILFKKILITINQVLIKRNASTIAAIDKQLFLNIDRNELLSPWAYGKPGVNLTLQKFANNFNATAEFVRRSILNEQRVEPRTVILENWIWTALSLLKELNDYSGFQAVMSALENASISRLKKTFAGISPEAQDALELMKTIIQPHNDLDLSILNSQIPAIPFISKMQWVFTGANENTAVQAIEDLALKRDEIAERTEAGKKRIMLFDLMKKEVGKLASNAEVDSILETELLKANINNEDDEYNKSIILEPIGNCPVQAANKLHLDFQLYPSRRNVASKITYRQILTQELIDQVKTTINQLGKASYQIDKNYQINWTKEHQENENSKRQIQAQLDLLKFFTAKLPKSSLTEEAVKLRERLVNIDIKKTKSARLQVKMLADLDRMQQGVTASEKLIRTVQEVLSTDTYLNNKCLTNLNQQLVVMSVQLSSLNKLFSSMKEVRSYITLSPTLTNFMKRIDSDLLKKQSELTDLISLIQLMQPTDSLSSAGSWNSASSLGKHSLSASRYSLLSVSSCRETEKFEEPPYRQAVLVRT